MKIGEEESYMVPWLTVHSFTDQASSKIQPSDVLIVERVCAPLLSCLHALETEHNELIDDMTKIDFPEPNVGRHPGPNCHQFPSQ